MNKFLQTSCLLLLTLTIGAQNIEFSPLSKYGWGDLQNVNNGVIQQMGGASAGFVDYNTFNFENPASLGFLRMTDIEVGLHAKYKTVKDNQNRTSKDWSGNLDHVALGVPLRNSINEILNKKPYKNYYGIAFGMKPYATTGYSFITDDSLANIGDIQRRLDGSGSYNHVFGSFGYQRNNIAAGIQIGYIFGVQRFEQRLLFLQQFPGADNYLDDQASMRALSVKLGSIYRWVLNQEAIKKDKSIKPQSVNFGAHVGLPTNARFKSSSLHTTIYDVPNYEVDTVYYTDGQLSNSNLPFQISIGAYYNHKEKSGFSFDYKFENWKNSKTLLQGNVSLANTNAVSLGYWYRPDISGYGKFFERINYRAGLHFQNDYREINGKNPIAWHATLGFGVPFVFQRQISMVNLGFSYGEFSWTEALRQNYFAIHLAFSVLDNEWFLKRRYD